MASKFSVIFLTICAIALIEVSGSPFEDAVNECKTQYKIDDAPIDYFFAKGSFPSGKENLKCLFECLANKLNLVDSNGTIDKNGLVGLVSQNAATEKELAVFSEQVIKSCSGKSASTSTCDKVYDFVKCGVDFKLKETA